MSAVVNRWFGRWAEPIGGFTLADPVRMALGILALLLRLFAGYKFIPYGYDKLLGGDKVYSMDVDFFRAVGTPLPEVMHIMIGALELFGGVALILGLLTRLFGFMLAGNMLVAMLTVGNTPEELPLFIACALLVLLGGGLLSVDQLLDRQLAARRGGAAGPAVDTRQRL